jgi:hypothetical protein
MHGDIGFHAHRLLEVRQGLVMLLSSNRGVDFPYPPALYLLLAPLTLTGLDDRVLLQLTSALFDALSPFLIYTITVRSLSWATGSRLTAWHWHTGVLAAGIYAFTAATLMTTWWNFSSHIFSQFAHLLLITTLIVLWPVVCRWAGTSAGSIDRPVRPAPALVRWRWPILIALCVLQSFVYLGHFGFWMNMSLLGAFCLAALLLGALRARIAWPVFRLFLAGFIIAEAFAALFFYSTYAGLFIAQAQATAAGGLTELANRQSVAPALLWRTLWEAGFRTHFGLFPVPLALCSLFLPWALGARPPGLIALMTGTFVIALLFAALPFLTGSTLATRWLMFSAWAIAVGAARMAQSLWRSGRAGRWLVVAVSCYIVWGTASMWLTGLAWRIRPPEPF